MGTLCGANCEECNFKDTCGSCEKTNCRPFGGRCVAAEYIKVGGKEKYDEFKEALKDEINGLLESLGLPFAQALYELPGNFVNLEYVLPCGMRTKFLDDKEIYLGAQVEIPDCERCAGIAANAEFIIICTYGCEGSDPELLLYKKR